MFGSYTYRRINWSLRKIRLPIGPADLVLDVGSGGNPHPAADVLLDRYIHTRHRNYAPLVTDRPVVISDACRMPFRDKVFDFAIAFHVLEHIPDPGSFLLELQRVSKAGYIETPSVLFERIVPYDTHVLEVGCNGRELVIHKKTEARPDPAISSLELTKTSERWHRLFYGNPDLFHVCYLWDESIPFKV